MTVLDAIEDIVRRYPERAKPGDGWPCCELMADALDLEGPSMPRAWHEAMNIWDPSRPFSPVAAVREWADQRGGTVWPGFVVAPAIEAVEPWGHRDVTRILDMLVPGRCIVQVWGYSMQQRRNVGHQVHLEYFGGGLGIVTESSVDLGVRRGGVPWHSGSPPNVPATDIRVSLRLLDRGLGVGVAPLPEGL